MEAPRQFHPFSGLPYELRLAIWEAARPLQRIVRLQVLLNDERDRHHHHHRVGRSSGSISGSTGSRYRVINAGGCELAGLLGANHESRRVTLAHYRLAVPSHPSRWSSQLRPLYVHPETDIIYIGPLAGQSGGHGVFGQVYLDCIADLCAADPRGVGLENLALEYSCMHCLSSAASKRSSSSSSASSASSASHDVFRRVLSSSLRRVYLVHRTQRHRPEPDFPDVPLMPQLVHRSGTLPIHIAGPDPRLQQQQQQEPQPPPQQQHPRCLSFRKGGPWRLTRTWRGLETTWGISRRSKSSGNNHHDDNNDDGDDDDDDDGTQLPPVECYVLHLSHASAGEDARPRKGRPQRDVFDEEIADCVARERGAWDRGGVLGQNLRMAQVTVTNQVTQSYQQVLDGFGAGGGVAREQQRKPSLSPQREQKQQQQQTLPTHVAGFWLFSEKDVSRLMRKKLWSMSRVDMTGVVPQIGVPDLEYMTGVCKIPSD